MNKPILLFLTLAATALTNPAFAAPQNQQDTPRTHGQGDGGTIALPFRQ
ncbi:MAG: hypothetical protein WCI20_06910 [bacterium]